MLKQRNTYVLLVLVALMLLLNACLALNTGTPQEKRLYQLTKPLEAAKAFRITSLDIAKKFWDQGLMKRSTADKIIISGDALQDAINHASITLKAYYQSNGSLGEADALSKYEVYLRAYSEFMDLVMPYVIKQMGGSSIDE